MEAFWELWEAFWSVATEAWQFAKTAWEVTFGKVAQMYNLPLWSLPLLEQVIYLVVLVAIVVTLVGSIWRLWARVRHLFQALVDLIIGIFLETPYLLVVLVMAIVAAWVITTFDLDAGLPNLQTIWRQMSS